VSATERRTLALRACRGRRAVRETGAGWANRRGVGESARG